MRRTWSVLSVYGSSLCMQFEYAILMPTVWEYVQTLGGDKFALGVVLSSFSIARVFIFFVIGSWMDLRGFREPYLFSFVCGILGSFLYGFAGFAKALWVLVLARIILGSGAANASLNEAFISKVYSGAERTKHLVLFDGTQILGIVAGPGLNLLFKGIRFQCGFLEFNELTAPGYFMTLMSMISFALVFLFVEEPEDYERLSQKDTMKEQLVSISESSQQTETPQRFISVFFSVLCRNAAVLVILIKFTIGLTVTVLETGLTPITKTEFHWGSFENSLAFAALGGVRILSDVF